MRGFLGALVVVVLAACGSSGPPSWVVEHEGRQSTLLGTMHAEVDLSELSPTILDQVTHARVLVTEADVRSSTVSQADLLAAVTLEGTQSIQDLVSPGDWQMVVRAASFVEPAQLARLQPWFIEGQIVLRNLPSDIEPIDAGLVARAERAGTPLAFFETWREQVTALNGLGVDDGLAILLRTARDPSATAAAHLEWADAYVAGDVERMTALAFDPAAMTARPAFYQQIVFRHDAWLARLDEEVRAGDAVIAVGFMHMLTDRGLPARLAARGYKVTER
ncbi:MAG: TraB/GumN family protein [Deltaproteobacteria bacterium]|nr:TraB/GumN family protein [Deltaproteobacteria bacterium]